MKNIIFAFELLFVAAIVQSQIVVRPGQKIQNAIDSASPGTRINVLAGTYAEQLLIRKDGICLEGEKGVILTAPATFTRNVCSGNMGPGTNVGICIAGHGITMDKFATEHRKVVSVMQPVEGVSVTGFQIQNFVGANILALGANNTHISHNKLTDGPFYGFLTSGSYNTFVDGNTVTSSDISNPGFIAMCMDNFKGAYFTDNNLSNYVIGFCMQTSEAEIQDNTVSFTCNGAYGDPFVKGVKFYNNHISSSYNQCGDFGSYGVLLSGTTSALIQNNNITNMHNNGPAAGVKIIDDPCTEVSLSCRKSGVAAVSKYNKVEGNTLKENDLDLWNNSTGPGNVFQRNRCTTSIPTGACHGLP